MVLWAYSSEVCIRRQGTEDRIPVEAIHKKYVMINLEIKLRLGPTFKKNVTFMSFSFKLIPFLTFTVLIFGQICCSKNDMFTLHSPLIQSSY